jgi:hypothetical protein
VYADGSTSSHGKGEPVELGTRKMGSAAYLCALWLWRIDRCSPAGAGVQRLVGESGQVAPQSEVKVLNLLEFCAL